MLGQARLDVLGLERLVESADDLHRLLPRHLHPLERLVFLDDLLHLGFDHRQVFVGDRPLGPHVVIEALANGGAEGQFDALEEPHHGAGHHMRRRMPHHWQGSRVTRAERFERRLAGLGQRRIEPHGLAVEQRRDRPIFFLRLLLTRGSEIGEHLGHAGRLGIVTNNAIR